MWFLNQWLMWAASTSPFAVAKLPLVGAALASVRFMMGAQFLEALETAVVGLVVAEVIAVGLRRVRCST